MENVQIFSNEEFGRIRTVAIEGEPWFVGKDVAERLGYKEPTKAAREKVDEEDRGVSKIDTPSGVQEMTIINESGLYSLVLSSKLPRARAFKRWVTSEVIPSIRKRGVYATPQAADQNGVSIGQTRLFAWMRSNGFLMSRAGASYNMPTQRAMEAGLFEVKESTFVHSDGRIGIVMTPKVTGKGQQYFINRFLKEKEEKTSWQKKEICQ